jgi:hypothetical protein
MYRLDMGSFHDGDNPPRLGCLSYVSGQMLHKSKGVLGNPEGIRETQVNLFFL